MLRTKKLLGSHLAASDTPILSSANPRWCCQTRSDKGPIQETNDLSLPALLEVLHLFQEVLPAGPAKVAPERQARRAQTPRPRLVDRPLGDGALRAHAGDDALEVGLYNDAADDHLAESGVEGLKVEDEVELADVLKEAVEGLNVDLDEVEQSQGALGRGGDDNEVEGGVVAVGDERGDVVVRLRGRVRGARGGEERREREEVAGTVRPVGDEGEYLLDQALLDARVLVARRGEVSLGRRSTTSAEVSPSDVGRYLQAECRTL